ncbi:MAG TPA: 6-phosphogluconolactonase [Verrucomicrobiae bacterium]|jgi:6-phosphogluconolactonase|nr:6-phosphogluconolactonase [Verrucomicrobiae bacterium]
MQNNSTIKIVPDAAALNQAAAEEFCRCAEAAIAERGRFTVALSGGSTPRSVYSLLAEWNKSGFRKIAWNKIFIFFGDERHVPPDHPESNYRMANESLLSHVPIPSRNVFRVHAELDANVAAQQYEDQLRKFFDLKPDEWPRFDLIMLGLGDDGHTASLFPGSLALNEDRRLVVANWVEKFQQDRITFTYPVLNHAAQVMFLASGQGKAQILREVLHIKSDVFPAQRVRPKNGVLLWLVDQDAARLLR